jgi:TPR repeat protein
MSPVIVWIALMASALPAARSLAAAGEQVAELEGKAESGDAAAQFQLGRAYIRGQGVEKNQTRGLELISEAAQAGHAEAMAGMGYLHMTGEGLEKDELKALEWLRKAADAGSLKAKGNLGVLLRSGKKIQLSNDESLRLLHEAADAGFIEAKSYLGRLYFTGDALQTQNREKARSYVQAAAEAGDPVVMFALGHLLRERWDPPDLPAARACSFWCAIALSKACASTVTPCSRQMSAVKSKGKPKVSCNLKAKSPLKVVLADWDMLANSFSKISMPFSMVSKKRSSSNLSVLVMRACSVLSSG